MVEPANLLAVRYLCWSSKICLWWAERAERADSWLESSGLPTADPGVVGEAPAA